MAASERERGTCTRLLPRPIFARRRGTIDEATDVDATDGGAASSKAPNNERRRRSSEDIAPSPRRRRRSRLRRCASLRRSSACVRSALQGPPTRQTEVFVLVQLEMNAPLLLFEMNLTFTGNAAYQLNLSGRHSVPKPTLNPVALHFHLPQSPLAWVLV